MTQINQIRTEVRRRSLRAAIVAGRTAILVSAVCAAACARRWTGEEIAPFRQAADIGPLHLAAHRGDVVVITFGFASCPDVCPLTLSRMRAVYRLLGADGGRVAMAFVTVDPERDRPESLERYVRSFDARIQPVHLDHRALGDVLTAYGVTAVKRLPDASRYRNLPGAGTSYSIDHTAGLFVTDKSGRLRLRIAHDAAAEAISADIRRLLEERDPPRVRVEAPVARLAPAGIGAVYFRIVNPAGDPDRLVAAESADADGVEMHESIRTAGDVVAMLPRGDGFEVPARATIDLAQGGKHLMLRGLAHPDSSKPIRIMLKFERSGEIALDVPVARREL
ncbi:MAG: SCO family protein [Myxococcales bacterium]